MRPNVAELNVFQARGTLATPRGPVSVAWKASPSPAFDMNIRARESVPITVDLPLRDGSKRVIVEKIVVWPEEEAKGAKPASVASVERIGDRLRVRVSGRNSYQLRVE
ncbi:MAG: hypothetical protein HYR85_06660 [Planctomycetes bacterium]|nr:hypothetical protein [Planctomycetota bacterium]